MPAIRAAAANAGRKGSGMHAGKNLFSNDGPHGGHASEEERQEALKAAKEIARVVLLQNRKNKAEDLAVFHGHAQLNYALISLRDNRWFQLFIIMVIFAAAILVGIQTDTIFAAEHKTSLAVVDWIIMAIFVIEIVVKFLAEGKEPWTFFSDPWNIFDFFIVVVGFVPIGGESGGGAVQVLRLVRLLRVLKLVKALPKLQILVVGLINSLSSILYIGILLLMLFYLFAVMGVSFFGKNDPVYMGQLHLALITLFRCATLEDWTDVMYTAMYGCDEYGYGGMERFCDQPSKSPIGSPLYFLVFIVLSSMMILNLFIGVITSSMQDAKEDLGKPKEQAGDDDADVAPQIEVMLKDLSREMNTIAAEVQSLQTHESDRRISAIATKVRKLSQSSPNLMSQSSMGGSQRGLVFGEENGDADDTDETDDGADDGADDRDEKASSTGEEKGDLVKALPRPSSVETGKAMRRASSRGSDSKVVPISKAGPASWEQQLPGSPDSTAPHAGAETKLEPISSSNLASSA